MFFNTLKSSALLPLMLVSCVSAAPQTKHQNAGLSNQYDDDPASRNAPTYSDDWTHLHDQGDTYFVGTESYTNISDGYFVFDWPEAPDAIERQFDIEIRAGKKNDRGAFVLQFTNSSETTLGFGDAFAPDEKANGSETIFSLSGFHVPEPSEEEGSLSVKVSNLPYGNQTTLALDLVTVSWNETA